MHNFTLIMVAAFVGFTAFTQMPEHGLSSIGKVDLRQSIQTGASDLLNPF